MKTPKEQLLDYYVQTGKEVLLKLRSDFVMVPGLGGMGPGALKCSDFPGIYSIETKVEIGGGQKSGLSFQFAAADVLWVTPSPTIDAGQIVTAPPNPFGMPSA